MRATQLNSEKSGKLDLGGPHSRAMTMGLVQ
jgi:hypothetical protein